MISSEALEQDVETLDDLGGISRHRGQDVASPLTDGDTAS